MISGITEMNDERMRIMTWELLVCLAIGVVVGYIFMKIHVPGGMLVGAIFGVAVFNIFTGLAVIPSIVKTIAQILAGAYIGSGINRGVLKKLPSVLGVLLIVLSGYIVITLSVGFLISRITEMDTLTAMMACVPGGMTDIPLIAADMGADVPKVAVLQFVRLIVGLGVFPTFIARVNHYQAPGKRKQKRTASKERAHWLDIALTLVIAAAFGALGKLSGIPAGALLFSTIGVAVFNCCFARACLPMHIKRSAQVLNGCYVGACFTAAAMLELSELILPAIILAVTYTANCLFMGFLIPRATLFTKKEAMLVATPSGASDMALISSDLGIDNPEPAIVQLFRMITVITVFPFVIRFVVRLIA